ncbi:hypothetical protein J6590_077383 [Homalodisca vitripennis]|nr:hypothetical protein J6590_077383 [Homalodisca vitripennis]
MVCDATCWDLSRERIGQDSPCCVTPRDAMYLGSVSAVPSKPSEDTGMAHWPVSKTLSLLGVAILVHLIVMTSLADRGPADEGTGDRPKRSVDPKRHRGSENTLAQDQNGRAAVFATENSTVVTAQITSTATLPCVVRKFGTGVVSWIRRKDFQLLTVGLATYSSDDRFMVEHARHLQNWGLQIHKVQKTDAGMYECQVSTHPPTSIFVELKVIGHNRSAIANQPPTTDPMPKTKRRSSRQKQDGGKNFKNP